MITMVQPLHAGNALRVFLTPPSDAVEWKLLRKGSGSFSGHDDPGAFLAYRGDDRVIVDVQAVPNEIAQFYCAFYTKDNGATWTPSNVLSGTARAIYYEHTTDVLSYLRERIEAGMAVEVQRGNFQPESGVIDVYTSPPVMEQNLRFPLVTLHLEREAPQERGIGEAISGDVFDSVGFDWQESEGWWADVRVVIIGWSLNGDERIELRKAIRRIIVANLTVFDGLGWSLVGLDQSDDDLINGEYPAQVFRVLSTFSCIAPVRVSGDVDAISQVFSRSSTNA